MEDKIQGKSKTQIKNEAQALQKLGEQLLSLQDQQLKRMGLPEKLMNALIQGKTITSNIAARRHRQYIGALMRDIDPEAIRQALQDHSTDIPVESKIDQDVRVWVDRLTSGQPEFIEQYLLMDSNLDRQQLRQLLRNIQKERKTGKPSKSLYALEQQIVKSLEEKEQKNESKSL